MVYSHRCHGPLADGEVSVSGVLHRRLEPSGLRAGGHASPRLTDYHAMYLAHELTKRCAPDSVEKLAGALVDAQVDLNPH